MMAITKKNVMQQELIGLSATVVQSKNAANVGISGKIINETQKTLVIRDKENKRVFKSNITIDVVLPSGETARVEGKDIAKRPWERIKV